MACLGAKLQSTTKVNQPLEPCYERHSPSTVVGTDHSRAFYTFPCSSVLLSTTFRAQPPDKCALECHQWVIGLPWIPETLTPPFSTPATSWVGPLALSNHFSLAVELYHFLCVAWSEKDWKHDFRV